MSNASTHLSLPYIQGGQAQKHITHNEALRKLDLVVQLSVLAQANAPQEPVSEGARYIVGTAPVAVWAGQSGAIALYEYGAWVFTTPEPGWIAFDQSGGGQIVFDGSAWAPLGTAGGTLPELGINATPDPTNRLAVASAASLFTHAGDTHQLKVNKASASDTASLVFQTNWSGRAEMGLTGSDAFEIKVSPDGSTFHTALQVSEQDGSVQFPNTAIASPAYAASVAQGLIANGTGLLGADVNLPAGAGFDAAEAPNMSGAFVLTGHATGPLELPEVIAVDPNRLYRLTSYLRQGDAPGNWSSFTHGPRHTQTIALRCYDADGLAIEAAHHARYHHAGIDSLTVLTQPLAPGDTVVHVADANGWNESDAAAAQRGLIVFGYVGTSGQRYDMYSRFEASGLFDLGDVNKATGVITLNAPLPASMANPSDPGGVWPVGTALANRSDGARDKPAFCADLILPQTDQWYQARHAIGGIDRSGRNIATNFAPGTAYVKAVLMGNVSNQPGGAAGFPDTGASHNVWMGGLAMTADPTGQIVAAPDGARDLFWMQGDPNTGTVSMVQAAPSVSAVA